MTFQRPLSSDQSKKAMLDDAVRRDRRAVLIVNTHARNGDSKFQKARALLEARGMTLDAAYAVNDPDQLPGLVDAAIAQGHRFIIVGGGDGTISSVIDSFAHREVVFGLLPLGTANSFARTLSIPLNLESAVDVIVSGKVVDVDLGKIDDDYFANGAALGLSAAIAQARPRTLKRWLGPAAYALVAAKALLRHRPFTCWVTVDGNKRTFEALELRIANGTHHGGIKVAEEASVESHDLVVYVIKGASRWKLARVWLNILLSRPLRGDDVEVVRTKRAHIETHPPQAVSVDGEVTTATPFVASVARQSLHLVVPIDRDDLH